jgi:hypothetical protein
MITISLHGPSVLFGMALLLLLECVAAVGVALIAANQRRPK